MNGYVKISFQTMPNFWPNSSDTDIVNARWDVVDADGKVAQIDVSGVKAAINSFSTSASFSVDGDGATKTFNFSAGAVTVVPTYPIVFDSSNIKGVEFWVEDHEGWKCIEPQRGETNKIMDEHWSCLLYTSPSPRDATLSRMPSSA